MEFQFILLDATCPGCTWRILLMLLGALGLGVLLGYLIWGRYKSMIDGLEADKKRLGGRVTELDKDNASLRYELEGANRKVSDLQSRLRTCDADKAILEGKVSRLQSDLDASQLQAGASVAGATVASTLLTDTGTPDSNLPTSDDDGGSGQILGLAGSTGAVTGWAAYGTVFQSDNLQVIEGIGPKIEGLLHDAGIKNWGELANTSQARLQEILDAAGSNYRMADPKSWPEQARLADAGEWEKLVEYQQFLDTGRETTGDFQNPSKIQKLFMKTAGFSNNPENLRIIEGIGPKIEGLLKNAGIQTWSDLANAGEDRLRQILSDAGDRYRLANPSSWSEQARLAADGKWAELKSYQDFLDGGKTPT